MSFVDVVKVRAEAGSGGNGLVSFRRERFVDKGGPDGGDGGSGGDVVLEAERNLNTLRAFRYQKLLKAKDGEPGGSSKRHGKNGEGLLVKVPVGTQVFHNGEIVADITQDRQQVVIAKGGKGGYGNAHFTSSVRQVPRIAEKGEPGEAYDLTFELKLIADVGLIGLPNAGKSTLLSVVSNARPEIADYPFTTLVPNLGVVDHNDRSFLFADIPGLIEGASQGKGLGDEFLRHIERTKVIVHLVDAHDDDPAEAYRTVMRELADYKTDLSKRSMIVVLSRTDGLSKSVLSKKRNALAAAAGNRPVLLLSSVTGDGVDELKRAVAQSVADEEKVRTEVNEPEKMKVYSIKSQQRWKVERHGDTTVVTGQRIESFARRTDFGSAHGLARLRDIMTKMGIAKELERRGVNPGDSIAIGTSEPFAW